ncbi:FAD-dependent oxidoreductase [Thermoactinomyces daqus]|uniref:4,4'-diaponeurosporene oxygenase n=2 Tax=Thermoactinomyces TaxID=2023 RepID=A0A7W2AJ99_9BACL|nr:MULTISPECIES: FAD-dependent oxidoreductase [Thermoactinomyces]MBA4543718.1 FAD-dependent oxidoreductase [Thermoactinomyces daqus]MBH8603840.1 FAD-dependent oxidoreductase [Thermoactinomyces sp. CICC 10522]
MMRTGVVIGGGVAGLVTAIQLAARGVKVTLFEKEAALGGRFRSVQAGDYFFDTGSSTVLMPWVFERFMRQSGESEPLPFVPLEVNSRHFFYNKTIVDLSADPDIMAEQLDGFSPEDRQGFLDYLTETGRLYETVEEWMLEESGGQGGKRFSAKWLKAWFSIHPFVSLDSFHRRFFSDPRLIAMMNRLVTGGRVSPYEAPSFLSFIAYLHLVQGTCFVEGGSGRLIELLEKRARSLGVAIHLNCPVERILVSGSHVAGVRAKEENWSAQLVVSAVDNIQTQTELLERTKVKHSDQPGSSAFLCLWGVKQPFPFLHHHNYFYPSDYWRHDIDLFDQQRWTESPIIYVGNPSASGQGRVATESRLHVKVNVPLRKMDNEKPSYTAYRDLLLFLLEKVWGLKGLEESLEVEEVYGPDELDLRIGTQEAVSPGKMVRRFRPRFHDPIRDRQIKGLYYTSSVADFAEDPSFAALGGIRTAKRIEEDWKGEMRAGAVR